MEDITVLVMRKEFRNDAITNLFYSSAINHNNMLRGVLILDRDVGFFKKSQHLLVIDNKKNFTVEKILSKFKISLDHSSDIKLETIPSYFMNCGEFFTYDEYKKKIQEFYHTKQCKKVRKMNAMNKIKEKQSILSEDEINEIYKSLSLPEDSKYNKADLIEYYLFFSNNINRYPFWKELKDASGVSSWKEFRKDLKNVSMKDIDFKTKTINIRTGHRKSAKDYNR